MYEYEREKEIERGTKCVVISSSISILNSLTHLSSQNEVSVCWLWYWSYKSLEVSATKS